MDTELIVQSIAIVIGAIFSAIQIQNLILRSRFRLKLDLEILQILDPKHPRYDDIRHNVDHRIDELFPTPNVPIVGHSSTEYAQEPTDPYPGSNQTVETNTNKFVQKPADFYPGLVLSLGATFITLYFIDIENWGWAIFSGIWAIAGFGGVMLGIDNK